MMKTSWLLAMLIGLCSMTAAEEISDTLGEHVVAPGETLWTITEKYLGDQTLWRENWALNPQIADPNKLRIGQRLKVIKERRISARTAEVLEVAHEVEKNLQRSDWKPATRGDDLAARDGVRTMRNASAALQFNDNTLLRLSEFSQIFLDHRETTLRNVDKGRIEVLKGSAELVFEPIKRSKTEIELVAGPAVTRPEANSAGDGRVRTVVPEDGGARVMVYSGFGTVDAGGESVRVGSGLGTAVPESGPPSKPEKLLGSPQGLTPGDGSEWRVANTPLAWQPMTGAASYVVEICRDPGCQALELRQSGLVEPAWQPGLTATGTFYWRVTGVSASGLEGYPSRSRSLRLDQLLVDEMGPRVAVIPVGFYHRDEQARLLVSPDSLLDLKAKDDAIGVDQIEFRWNQDDWQEWQGNPLPLTGIALPATFEARASDQLGQLGPVAVVPLAALQ
jgi:hypothetical protein